MIRLQVAEPTAEQLMVPVCCEEFEAALGVGVLTQARGLVYVRQGAVLWRVGFCPFCGAAVDEHLVEVLPDEPEPAPVEPRYVLELAEERTKRRRRCSLCLKKGHYASTCTMVAP